MNGSIYPYSTKAGKRWRVDIQVGGDRHQRAGFKLKREAEDWRDDVKARYGDIRTNDKRTLAVYMAWWLGSIRSRLSPKTHERYTSLAGHITKKLGQVRLTKLDAVALEGALADMAAEGMSAATVKHVRDTVRAALGAAVRLKILPFNVALSVVVATPAEVERPAIDEEATRKYMDAADQTWVGPVIRLAAATGARRGELLGLRWSDVDLATGVLTIRRSVVYVDGRVIEKSTKSKRIRKVRLPQSAVRSLLDHLQRQREERDLFGGEWTGDLMFCAPGGEHLRPGSVSRACRRIARQAGVPDAGLQVLRHSHGSQLLSAGSPLPAVSKRLGHSTVYTTATVYSHALGRDEDEAAVLLDERVFSGSPKSLIEGPAAEAGKESEGEENE